MAGLGYLILSLAALISWKAGIQICNKDICDQLYIGFFDRPWILWGAVFYALAGLLIINNKRCYWVAGIVGSGVFIHASLIYYGYQISKTYCPSCLAFLGANVLLLVFYLTPWKGSPLLFQNYFKGIGKGLLTVSMILLIIHYTPLDRVLPEQAIASAHTTQSYADNKNITNKPSVVIQTYEEEKNIDTNNNSGFGPKVKVINKIGGYVEINLNQRPALLFSWWCPHCDYALQNMAKYHPNDRPYLVACYNDGNQRELIEKKLVSTGLDGADYFILDSDPPVDGVPTLVWWANGKLEESSALELKTNANKLIGQAQIYIGSGNGAHNAVLAAEAINSHVILPGGVFSFNETVGERTSDKGYLSARQIVSTSGGFTYANGVGGGICRTATVLHKAVVAAGLMETEHHRHSLAVNYDDDTAVAWEGWDYKFRNNLSSPVTINAEVIRDNLIFELWN